MKYSSEKGSITFQVAVIYLLVSLSSALLVIPWNPTALTASSGGIFSSLSNNTTAAVIIFFAVLFISVVLIRTLQRHQSWQLFFALTAFAGLFEFFSTILGYIFSHQWLILISACILTVIVLLIRVQNPQLWIHNMVVLTSIAGLAKLFGTQLLPTTALAALIILCVYDLLLSRSTTAPIQIARQLFSRDAFFGCIIPWHLSEWKMPLEREHNKPLFILGPVDIAFPTFFYHILIMVRQRWSICFSNRITLHCSCFPRVSNKRHYITTTYSVVVPADTGVCVELCDCNTVLIFSTQSSPRVSRVARIL